jgi:hypothetical protein
MKMNLIVLALFVSVVAGAAPHDEPLPPSTRIPFDPRADLEEQIANPLLWKAMLDELDELRRCVIEKRGEAALPGAGETESDPFRLAMKLGVDLNATEPSELLDKRAFGEMLRDRHRELLYLCGETPPSALLLDQFSCRRACNLSWEGCYSDCQSQGPPSPACVGRCDRNEFWCSIVCAFY